MISHTHKAIFIHVPKVAGQSLALIGQNAEHCFYAKRIPTKRGQSASRTSQQNSTYHWAISTKNNLRRITSFHWCAIPTNEACHVIIFWGMRGS